METLLARLTPPGKAAIATLGLRGPRAWELVRQLFRPSAGNLSDEPLVGRFWFGRLGDEVVLAVKGRDAFEVHCHGGVEVVRMIEEMFVERGVHIVPWQTFLEATPIEQMLVNAPTTRTASILLEQTQGVWEKCAKDHDALVRLRDLIPLGKHLVEPWKIVIAGAPNVGKSSLMNALAGYSRSIVAPTPGTTRDVVSLRLAIDGWPIELIDTAGIRDATSSLEGQGIERGRAALREADLRVWVVDGSSEPLLPDDVGSWLIVINKIDLQAAWNWNGLVDALHVSARTGAGLADLCGAMSRLLVPLPPAPGEAVPCMPGQAKFVTNALELLAKEPEA